MANILIAGDSWACIPWQHYYRHKRFSRLENEDESSSIIDDWFINNDYFKYNIFDWLDFQFTRLGHNVNNIGFWSDNNDNQLKRLQGYLQGSYVNNNPIDLIVWFHTEIVRDWFNDDWNYAKSQGYYEYLRVSAKGTYNWVTMIKKTYPNTKWAIIGGHAALHEKEKHLLDWAEFRIDNWRQEITGIECPECHVTTFLKMDHKEINSILSLDEKEIELQKIETIINACKDKELFYDNVHPNVKPSKELATRIIKHFNLGKGNNG